MEKVIAIMVIAELFDIKEKNGKKRKWRKEWLADKEELSNTKLLKQIRQSDPLDYKNYMRMSEASFMDLLNKVAPLIKKQDTFMREAIPIETRLSITLRFLATGNAFEDLKFAYTVSPQAIGKIVIETCRAINVVLKQYIMLPRTADNWKRESIKFFEKTGYPHCLGAIDGKHIHIKKPSKSGSFYFNYKKTFSVVLMAVVNADCEFLMVDVGTNGRISDGGVFSNTKFYDKLNNGELGLPDPTAPFSEAQILPYVFVGDDAFPLRSDLMKPYAHDNLTSDEVNFNRKLSSARVRVENAFGILASRFRLLHTIINLSPEKVTTIVLTCCYLHNYLRKLQGISFVENSAIASTSSEERLIGLDTLMSRNSTKEAKNIRHKFCEVIALLNE